MSREQWGHGYWKGVEDATNGNVNSSVSDIARYFVCQMCIANKRKECDRLLFSVTLFRSWCIVAGFSDRYAKRIYDYILNNEPYGCYVSGESWNKWTQDCFVLPNLDDEDLQAEASKIATNSRSLER